MNKKELKLILEEGEGYKIEFKESLSNFDKELVTFSIPQEEGYFLEYPIMEL